MDCEDIFWILTKFAVYSFIYIFGRFYYDISWFIPLFFTALRDYAKRKHELSRVATQCALRREDRDAVLSRLERLDEIPAWVLFPDVERAEWFNTLLKRFWPNLNEILTLRVRKFETKLKSSAILSTFKFTKIELGRASPRITGIKVYDKNIPCRDLMIDLSVSYIGDCELNFTLNGIAGGIKDIQVEGVLRVILKPLKTEVPHIAAVQIYFLRHPTTNFELTSALAMLDMFSTGDLIRSILKEQISKTLVYPNKIKIQLCPESEDMSFKMPSIDGVLRADIKTVQGISERKVFLTSSLGNETWKSESVDVLFETADCYFEYELVSYDLGDHELEIAVNKIVDEEGKTEKIGRITIDKDEIKLNKRVFRIFNSDSSATITAELTWLEVTMNNSDKNSSMLQIYVDSIRTINSKFHPFVKITIDDKDQETPVAGVKNEIANIEKHLNFIIHEPGEKSIELKIIDQLSSVVIGEFNYKIADLLVRNNFEQDLQAFPLTNDHDSEIILALKLNFLKTVEE